MNLSEKEIETCFSKIENQVYIRHENQNTEEDFFTLFDLLRKDSYLSKNNEKSSQSGLKHLLSSDNKDIVEKYLQLKEDNKKLKEEHDDLVKRLDSTAIEYITDRENMKMEFSTRLMEIEQHYQSEIETLRLEKDNEKKNHTEQMSTLLNQMSAVQASSAIECDEMETKLKKQLIEANNKLREFQNHCRSLNIEIQHLRTQLKNEYATKSSPRTSSTFNDFQQEETTENQVSSANNNSTPAKINNENQTKYPQLQITKTNSGQESNINLNIRIPPLYKSYSTKTNVKPTRKRKLYDPNDPEFELDEY